LSGRLFLRLFLLLLGLLFFLHHFLLGCSFGFSFLCCLLGYFLLHCFLLLRLFLLSGLLLLCLLLLRLIVFPYRFIYRGTSRKLLQASTNKVFPTICRKLQRRQLCSILHLQHIDTGSRKSLYLSRIVTHHGSEEFLHLRIVVLLCLLTLSVLFLLLLRFDLRGLRTRRHR